VRSVTVQFLKNPDELHWGFEGHWLGADEWGGWISVPAGSRRWKGAAAKAPTATPAVFCAPNDAWWHLHYNGDTTEYSHFVDIATPPIWVSADRYEMIDLDLDVVRGQDGIVAVQDEDEFRAHQARYGYSQEMIDRAEQETSVIVSMLESGAEPFFEVAAGWLARLTGTRRG
jgi:protein associated with RNAse G/E